VSTKKSSVSATSEIDELISRLLSRIVVIFMRLGLDSPQSEKLLRTAFIHAALERTRFDDKRPTQSQIASLTGLSRLEVRTILGGKQKPGTPQISRIDQVLVGWKTDPQFLDARGKPKPLDMRGPGTSFESLAKKYGRDVTPRTLREDLTKRGIAMARKRKLVLIQDRSKNSGDAIAAHADLKFLASHLNAIDFQLGRRSYVMRQGAIAAEDKRALEMLKRIAVTRLETVFSSLSAMSTDSRRARKAKRGKSRRLLITAVVAAEAEGKNA
jgi:hypothetical protein